MSLRTVHITRAAVLLALLVAWQYASAPLGITLITGSGVNLILACCAVTCGFAPGLLMALISPFLARMLGIGPTWVFVPFIAAGNLVFALIWRLLSGGKRYTAVRSVIAAIAAAIVKFAVIYIGIVQIAIPLILKPSEKAAETLSAAFSVPQLISALIGGGLAIAVLPIITSKTRV